MLESLEDQLFRRLLPKQPPRLHQSLRTARISATAPPPRRSRRHAHGGRRLGAFTWTGSLPRYLDDAPGAGASRTFSWEPSSYALHADQGSGTDLPWPRASPSASPLRLRVSMERPPLQACERCLF